MFYKWAAGEGIDSFRSLRPQTDLNWTEAVWTSRIDNHSLTQSVSRVQSQSQSLHFPVSLTASVHHLTAQHDTNIRLRSSSSSLLTFGESFCSPILYKEPLHPQSPLGSPVQLHALSLDVCDIWCEERTANRKSISSLEIHLQPFDCCSNSISYPAPVVWERGFASCVYTAAAVPPSPRGSFIIQEGGPLTLSL